MKHPVPTALPLPAARRLRTGQHVHLAVRQPLCLRAERGTLWVTVDGRAADIVLEAGASARFEPGAVVTVGPLGSDAVLTAVAVQALQPLRTPAPGALAAAA